MSNRPNTSLNRDRETGRVFFPNLDGLRFVAFLFVYLQHGFQIAGVASVGVAFFFVLSGFLITFLILAEIDTTGCIDVAAFYVRRILRIWPLYYAVLFFCFVVYPLLKGMLGLPPTLQTGSPLWYLLFLSNFDVMRVEGLEGAMSTNVTWSVAIEEQFYLSWPLLFRLVPPRFFALMFSAIILASTGFRLAYAHDPAVLYFHSFSVISDMAMGGLAAFCWRRFSGLRSLVTELTKAAVLVIYCCSAVLALTVAWWGGTLLGPLERVVSSGFFAFVVLEQNFSRGSFFKMSRLPVVTSLGRYTYGLYLLHTIVITLLEGGLLVAGAQSGSGMLQSVVLGPVGLTLSILSAAFSYHFFESRFLQLKTRFAHIVSGNPS